MKINLVMIVRNEERSLERCLKSAEHLVDDIIIADTGSADRTKEIARNAGPWSWNMSGTMIFPLPATLPWIIRTGTGIWSWTRMKPCVLIPGKVWRNAYPGCGLHTDRRGWEPLQGMIPTMTVTESVSAHP